MEEFESEEEKRIDSLYHSVAYLKEIHEDISVLEHALIERGEESKPYSPTFFLYVFFSFNALYNIDWTLSKDIGEQVDAKGGEEDKIKALIDFCFSDEYFVDSYYPVFRDIVTMRSPGGSRSIHRSMRSINVDEKRVTASKAGDCQAMYKVLLDSDTGFTSKNVKTLSTFIYDVRCNIVHGTKSFDDLRKPKQAERIVYYSFFLIAIQHMLFMYLEYLQNGSFKKASSQFLELLRAKQWLPIMTKTNNSTTQLCRES